MKTSVNPALILEKRGQMERTESLDTRRVMLHCELPLNEILVDFKRQD